MKNLLIIGARGYGREICDFASDCKGYGTEFVIKGYLDDKSDALDNFPGNPPIIDSVENYQPQKDDVFICALGEVKYKKKYCEMILAKGGEFINLISNRAYVSDRNTTLRKGCIVCPAARIHCDVTVGDFVTVQPFAVLGHDVKVGNWCHINDYSDCGGGSQIGNEVTINTQSFILPKLKVGDRATIGAGSIVLRNVKEGVVVFGNPAKPLPLPKAE